MISQFNLSSIVLINGEGFISEGGLVFRVKLLNGKGVNKWKWVVPLAEKNKRRPPTISCQRVHENSRFDRRKEYLNLIVCGKPSRK